MLVVRFWFLMMRGRRIDRYDLSLKWNIIPNFDLINTFKQKYVTWKDSMKYSTSIRRRESTSYFLLPRPLSPLPIPTHTSYIISISILASSQS